MKKVVVLDDGWEFRQASTTSDAGPWKPAVVPGAVHLDLLRNRLIPGPFYRENEANLQWIENANWEYRKSFTLSSAELAHRHLEMVFNGLDTTATVFLNDKQLLKANNMFRAWRVDAKPLLREGNNSLRVEFVSDVREGERLASLDPANGETHIPAKSYVRKAAYEYGWDWGPRFVTSGIWRPVALESWDEARIDNLLIEQPDIGAECANLVARIQVAADRAQDANLELTWKGGGHTGAFAQHVTVHEGANEIVMPVQILKPSLWYPNGYGSHPLYDFTARLKVNGRFLDERTARTGLRKIVLRQDRDQWGRQFAFEVNGTSIFIKGADVIPFDSFPTRVTIDRYRQFLGPAADAHMNMVRLWGGGYYESDQFYDMCDELGLLVLHDFMFASSWYPGSEEWKDEVRREAEYQVSRLRNHPSIAMWSGNNEVESVLGAFLGGLSEAGKLQVWKNYLTTFSGVLPRVTERLEPEIPYWPSSPSSDYEKTSDSFQAGDAHDWSIWHGREPFENYRKRFYRFNSEYGFQSFPELKTVESFTTAEDRANIFTPVMLAHQKNNEGNSIIHEYMLRDYGEPKDFASLLYASQVLQAEGIKVGAEHMRRNRPRIMGSLFWQLNDCWPVASWSSIDSFGRWKALQYYARRFYSPVLASPNVENGQADVFVISDRTVPVEGVLTARFMTLDGRVVLNRTQKVIVPPLSAVRYMQEPLEALAAKEQNLSQLILVVDFKAGDDSSPQNIIYLTPTRQVHLPKTTVSTVLRQSGGEFTLTLASDVVARDVYVTFGDLDATPSDNFLDLLPGESREITIHTTASKAQLQDALKTISLVDAFGNQTDSSKGTSK